MDFVFQFLRFKYDLLHCTVLTIIIIAGIKWPSMAESLRFKFKRTSEKPKLLKTKEKDEEETEYISSTAAISSNISKSKKKKELVIHGSGNLWKPGNTQVDEITEEAINQILSNPDSISATEAKQIDVTNSTSSLKFPGVVPQEESTLNDYNDVPITDFGEALMRGMGWEKGKGVGRNRKIVEPIDFAAKKRTLGVTVHEEEAAEAERLFHDFKLGDYVEIMGGQDKGKHAKILSLSLETSRCIVRIPSEEMIDLAIINIKKGSREEYLKQRDQIQETASDVFVKPAAKRHKAEKPSATPSQNGSSNVITSKQAWLHQDLKVRIVSEEYSGGKYYCKKLNIVDIVDPWTCVCRTEGGKLLENVPQSILETVIPKKKGSLVMLLSKKNRFELAELEEKDSKSSTVVCVTLIEKDVVTASYDEVCQYVGDAVR